MSTHTALDETFIRSQFPALSNGWTFFDNAGGSQIVKGAVSRISEYLFEKNVQIGGTYETSRAAADALYAGRTAMKTFMNATREEEIVFGHSTTVLLQNLANSMRSQLSPGDEIVVTVADHESNIGPWVRLEEFGIVIKFWPFNHETGDLEIEDLVPLMSDKTRLVCVHHVSNVVGVVQPVAQIASLVHEYGAKLCVDGVAYAPHRAIDVQAWDVDYYVFSLYKTYGPHCAVMYGKYDLLLELDSLYHYFYGKDKVPGKLEPGNPNYELAYSSTGIVDYLIETGERTGATGSDRDKLVAAFSSFNAHEDKLVERAMSRLRARNDCRVIGPGHHRDRDRVPTISFTLEQRDPAKIAQDFEPHKIAIRFGDFHARRLVEDMGLGGDKNGVIRISLTHYNTIAEVDRFLDVLETL